MALILGDLRERIEILKPVVTRDKYGAAKTTYESFTFLRAGKKEISGTKLIDKQEYFNTNRIDWTIHFRRNITDDMRVRQTIKDDNGNVITVKDYKIQYIREIVYKQGLVLETELINN